MRRLRAAIRLKTAELWANNFWFLHHDNAASHTALVPRDHFVKNSTHIVPQPPYRRIWLRVTSSYSRKSRDHSGERVSSLAKKALMAIPEKVYLACFGNTEIRWYKCILSRGDYFEGDKIDLQE